VRAPSRSLLLFALALGVAALVAQISVIGRPGNGSLGIAN
jgi:hypothetical protein